MSADAEWEDTEWEDTEWEDNTSLQPIRSPATWSVLRQSGLYAAIQFKFERICVGEARRCHEYARRNGHNLVAPGYKSPWWFKWASRIEFWARKKYDLKRDRCRKV